MHLIYVAYMYFKAKTSMTKFSKIDKITYYFSLKNKRERIRLPRVFSQVQGRTDNEAKANCNQTAHLTSIAWKPLTCFMFLPIDISMLSGDLKFQTDQEKPYQYQAIRNRQKLRT